MFIICPALVKNAQDLKLEKVVIQNFQNYHQKIQNGTSIYFCIGLPEK